MEIITNLDHMLFQWINKSLSTSFFDVVAPILRDAITWLPFYVILLVYLLWRFRIPGLIFIVFIMLAVGLADSTSSKFIKKSVKRARPCHVLKGDQIRLRVHCGSGYSFTSSHAANHFSLASFLVFGLSFFISPCIKALIWTWASCIALAQVYVGVHYPLDIIFGAVLGIFMAMIVLYLYARWIPKNLQLKSQINRA